MAEAEEYKISELDEAVEVADDDLVEVVIDTDTVPKSRKMKRSTLVDGLASQADLDDKADASHNHDDRYYTEDETNTLLADKANATDVPATIVESVVAGSNVSVDNTDPANPVVSASGGGGGEGGAVDSVNGQAGEVVLDADDIDDAATTHKFATAAQLSAADSAVQPGDLADFETSTELNDRDTANRDRGNHTGTQTASTISDFASAADARINAAAGVTLAGLSGGQVPTAQIPAVALTKPQTAASEAEMLALTTQAGDVVVRTDENQTYMHNGGTAGTMADFTRLNTPTDAVTSVNSQTGDVVLGKGDVGLGNADNTADADKPVSTAQQDALDTKATKTEGMGVIAHGATASTDRPAGYTVVTWIGSVEPDNAINDDHWIVTSA